MKELMERLAALADEADESGNVDLSADIDDVLRVMAGKLTTKQRKKAPSVFKPGKQVKPDKGRKTEEKHFPIPDLAHARNALSRVEQYDSVPSWYNGSLESLKAAVRRKVYNKYPGLRKRKEAREGK